MENRTPRALVVYESLFGATTTVARAIAVALEESFDVRVGSIYEIPSTDAAHADLLIVGGPTHSRAMSTHTTRVEAIDWSRDVLDQLRLLVDERTMGVREWIDGVGTVGQFCAFDTRPNLPRILSGTAASGISHGLRRRGGRQVIHPESFFVNPDHRLVEFEDDRASAWGENLARRLVPLGAAV